MIQIKLKLISSYLVKLPEFESLELGLTALLPQQIGAPGFSGNALNN